MKYDKISTMDYEIWQVKFENYASRNSNNAIYNNLSKKHSDG